MDKQKTYDKIEKIRLGPQMQQTPQLILDEVLELLKDLIDRVEILEKKLKI